MNTQPTFRPLAVSSMVRITVNGDDVDVPSEATVAAALLLAVGASPSRFTPVSGAPRAPYCMMGVCFECLVEIDDRANRQACLVMVRPGMNVCTQYGVRAIDSAIPLPTEAEIGTLDAI